MPKKSPTAKPSKKVTTNKKDDAAFQEDFANFLGDPFATTDKEEEETEEGLDDHLVQVGPTNDRDAGAFWKNPEVPEKYLKLDHVNVENLVNMLSKIRLVRLEDLPHYDELEFSTEPDRAKYPSQFYRNTDKEKVVLWHAENFRRQFLHKFPDRRPPVIAPRNECGCQKLFPTYINPSAIGYPEFFDCVTTVEFLKDFFTPALLNPPTKFPDRIRSHVTVIKKRNASAFEICGIAVSSLIGTGYNAYVVDGFVSRTLSTIETPVPTVSPSKYRFKKKGATGESDGNPVPADTPIVEDISSTLVVPSIITGGGGGHLGGGEEGEEEEEPSEPDEELPSTAKDRYHGKRTHAWILILPGGQQEVEKPFFLEPYSGTLRQIKDPNFLSIEAVFNHKNYWINIQNPPKNLSKLNYNLDDSSAWSSLLTEPDYKKKRRQSLKGSSKTVFQDDDDDDAGAKVGELYLTMPVSWTTDMDISQEEYDMKYPSGKKTIEYNDAIEELAAPYVNDDGLVRKVLKFMGPSRDPEDLEYIEEHFEHRKDKLVKRKWLRDGKMLHEYFDPGRKDALKEHVHVSGRNRPDFPRDLYYYSNAHPRSVSHRRIIKKGMIERFEDRDDKLFYKITLFGGMLCNAIPTKEDENRSKARHIIELVKGAGAGGGGGKKRARRKITKIVEKYGRAEEKEPSQDIAEKHMLIEEGRLRILFHYFTGNLTRNTLELYKGVKPGQSKYAPVEYRPEDCIEYQADREAEPMNVFKKFTLLQQIDRDERSSSVLSREAEDEIYQTVGSRVQEDWRHEIEPDAFAGDRNEEYLRMMKEQQGGEEGEEEVDLSGTDFTTPFFEKYGYPRSKKEEILMKKRIMLHEKVKILRRAYMIKQLYDKESALLREKQEWYMRHIDQVNQTQEEDFSHMYKERLFQMHILEPRMMRHQQETPRQYYNVLVQLLRHPQLNRFTNKKVPPPPPPIRELTEDEKMRIAKLKDCCQFYSFRYTEPRRSRNKNQKQLAESRGSGGGAEETLGEVKPPSTEQEGSTPTPPTQQKENYGGSNASEAGGGAGGDPQASSVPPTETPPSQPRGDSSSSGTIAGNRKSKGRNVTTGETDVAKLS